VNRNLKGCNPSVLCQIYQALFRPIMAHGAPGWHPKTKDNINKFQWIQNRASRFIFGKCCSHELDTRIMSVKQYLIYTDLWYFYKCRNDFLDCNITQAVGTVRPIRGQDGVRLIPLRVRTTYVPEGFFNIEQHHCGMFFLFK
jgi:hypothetical protein